MSRALRFRSLQIREIGATVCGATVALVVAFSGTGMGDRRELGHLLRPPRRCSCGFWPVRPTFEFSMREPPGPRWLRLKVFGARILSWPNGSYDNVLVGRYLGAGSLGAYSLAYNVMFMPMARVGLPLQQVVSPVFARLQTERERLERAWLREQAGVVRAPHPRVPRHPRRRARSRCVAFGSSRHASGGPAPVALRRGGRAVARGAPLRHPAGVRRGQCPAPAQHRRRRRHDRRVHRGIPFGIVGVAAFYAAARWLLVRSTLGSRCARCRSTTGRRSGQGRHRCRSGSSATLAGVMRRGSSSLTRAYALARLVLLRVSFSSSTSS